MSAYRYVFLYNVLYSEFSHLGGLELSREGWSTPRVMICRVWAITRQSGMPKSVKWRRRLSPLGWSSSRSDWIVDDCGFGEVKKNRYGNLMCQK
ncbi:hypothetical protein JTE90_010366 [Oedothorax gibbosus]|uniref:Uncharacterized protein n=1 Tax=Oedothorax gibbosus TaxID=931172 RepID=A0AAV6VZI0_9ARAC|nr:hypothetical protein JTE90_010366 [Oedothorax gibbosus]